MSLAFFGNLGHRVKLAGRLPPRLVLAKLAKRLPWTDKHAVRLAELLHSPTDLRPDRLIGFFREQEGICVGTTGLEPVGFHGKRMLEIGPGPLGGWGPMAIFRGAESVHAVDPDWVDGVLDAPAIEAAYLQPHHAALTAIYGPLMSYDAFRAGIRDRLAVVKTGLADLRLSEPVDLVLSNSCLEHIDGLSPALKHLATLMRTGARFHHLVNFGNHRDRHAPFRTIYEMPPESYWRRYSRHINLMRASDIGAAFQEAGLPTRTVVVDRRLDYLTGLSVDPWWRGRYTDDDLATRTALFVGSLGRTTDAEGNIRP